MYVTIVLNPDEGYFMLDTNIKRTDIGQFLVDWIKTDIGKGEDPREYEYKKEYYVSIHQNGDGDYEVEDNCGNRDLRRGVLGAFIKDYKYLLHKIEEEEETAYAEMHNFIME